MRGDDPDRTVFPTARVALRSWLGAIRGLPCLRSAVAYDHLEDRRFASCLLLNRLLVERHAHIRFARPQFSEHSEVAACEHLGMDNRRFNEIAPLLRVPIVGTG